MSNRPDLYIGKMMKSKILIDAPEGLNALETLLINLPPHISSPIQMAQHVKRALRTLLPAGIEFQLQFIKREDQGNKWDVTYVSEDLTQTQLVTSFIKKVCDPNQLNSINFKS